MTVGAILLILLFVAVHLLMHRGHGGHARHGSAAAPVARARTGGAPVTPIAKPSEDVAAIAVVQEGHPRSDSALAEAPRENLDGAGGQRPGPAAVRSGPGPRTRAAALAAVVIAAATCAVVVKAGIAFAPPILFGGLRSALAGAVLLLIAAFRKEPVRLGWPMFGWVAAIALLATTAPYGGMFLAPAHMGAGVASVLANLQPLFTIALAAAFLGERLTLGGVVALAAGVAGVVVLVGPNLSAPGAELVGPASAVAASIGAAAGSVMVRRLRDRVPVLSLAGWQLLLGSLPLLGAGLVGGGSIRWTGAFVAALLYLALVGTAFSTALWFWLLRFDEAGRLSLYLFLIPLLGLLLGVLVFREPLRLPELAGGALVAGAVALAAADRRRQRARRHSAGASSLHERSSS
jgi:drug/metabolite transporter (DMT)-like permease